MKRTHVFLLAALIAGSVLTRSQANAELVLEVSPEGSLRSLVAARDEI